MIYLLWYIYLATIQRYRKLILETCELYLIIVWKIDSTNDYQWIKRSECNGWNTTERVGILLQWLEYYYFGWNNTVMVGILLPPMVGILLQWLEYYYFGWNTIILVGIPLQWLEYYVIHTRVCYRWHLLYLQNYYCWTRAGIKLQGVLKLRYIVLLP